MATLFSGWICVYRVPRRRRLRDGRKVLTTVTGFWCGRERSNRARVSNVANLRSQSVPRHTVRTVVTINRWPTAWTVVLDGADEGRKPCLTV